jgi:putative tryptophan/tyrosine transport system substrate-binding protein
MRRREFIAGLLLVGMAQRAPGQQPEQMRRIAFVHPSTPVAELRASPSLRIFFDELGRLGHVEGRNLTVELFSGEGRTEHFAELARDVVRLKPDAIFTIGPSMVRGLKAATGDIPVVAGVGDPVGAGLVASLARPGANITGVSVDTGMDVYGKRLGLLKEAIPGIARMSFLASHRDWQAPEGQAVREAAERAGVSLVGSLVDDPMHEAEYRRAFASISQEGVDAILVSNDIDNFTNRRLVVELTAKTRLPTMFPWREHVELGGLMAYAFDLPELFRHAARQIDLVLKGTNPGEIPFYQATKFELVINLKTAKALGVTFPPGILVAAAEVIE